MHISVPPQGMTPFTLFMFTAGCIRIVIQKLKQI